MSGLDDGAMLTSFSAITKAVCDGALRRLRVRSFLPSSFTYAYAMPMFGKATDRVSVVVSELQNYIWIVRRRRHVQGALDITETDGWHIKGL